MGISIKREDTERLAREVAARRGAGLTEAIHHALAEELSRLERVQKAPQDVDRELARLFAQLDSLGPGNGKSRGAIEDDLYGAFGEPV